MTDNVKTYQSADHQNIDNYVGSVTTSLTGGNTNGGEAADIRIHAFENSDEHRYYTLELSTQCYGTHATSVTVSGIEDIDELERTFYKIFERVESMFL